jgi:AAA family ATP:ADP antiporter
MPRSRLAVVLWRLLGVRREDRRDTAVAFATLVALLSGHAMLETARDALFLAKLAPEELPLAYIAVAVLALGVAKLNQLAGARVARRTLLSLTLVAGALVTAGFFWISTAGAVGLVALYVWTGLLATVAVVQFWLQLGEALHVGQAKRLFAVIGAGGLVGATLGSALAGALLALPGFGARSLLLTAAAFMLLAALASRGFRPPATAEATRRRAAAEDAVVGSLVSLVRRDGYLLRLLVIALLSAVLFTGVDYVFKASAVAAARAGGVPLGVFFARYYALVNAMALAVQLLVAPRLLRAVGVNRALLVLPLLVVLGAGGVLVTVGATSALLLKAADGTLRHSVHRTASEILYLPLARHVRERFKGIAEAVGQRGGQAVGAVLILLVAALAPGAEVRIVGAAIVVLGATWLACMIGLEARYLELFRSELRAGTLDTDLDVPELDLASFELLVGALSAEDDGEVLAALDLFAAYGKTALVPALILYHPSRAVVLRALDLFGRTQRTDVLRLAGRLLRHEDPEIRAAALHLMSGARPDEAMLREHLADPAPAVRCTAVAGLVAAGRCTASELGELRAILDGDDPSARRALARTLRWLPAEPFLWAATALVERVASERGLGNELACALALAPHACHIRVLIALLADRESRRAARAALVSLGDEALAAIEQALADPDTPQAVRLHLPRTVSRFGSARAARVLLDGLAGERDEAVAFKMLRGLGRMRAVDPGLAVDRQSVLDLARRALERAVGVLHWRIVAGAITARRARAITPAAELLVALLEQKEREAIERLFRLLHVLEPKQEFRVIYAGLTSKQAKARASGRELLSMLVPEPLRDGILALVEDAPPRQRLRATAEHGFDPPGREALAALLERGDDAEALDEAAAALLGAMLDDVSDAIRVLASYHAAELGLEGLRERLAVATAAPRRARERDLFAQIANRALEIVGGRAPAASPT